MLVGTFDGKKKKKDDDDSLLNMFFFLIIIGASGTGRTTFVNTLCDDHVLAKKVCDNPEDAHSEEGIHINPVSVGKQRSSSWSIFETDIFFFSNIDLDEDGIR